MEPAGRVGWERVQGRARPLWAPSEEGDVALRGENTLACAEVGQRVPRRCRVEGDGIVSSKPRSRKQAEARKEGGECDTSGVSRFAGRNGAIGRRIMIAMAALFVLIVASCLLVAGARGKK